jgi:hypothetical protein
MHPLLPYEDEERTRQVIDVHVTGSQTVRIEQRCSQRQLGIMRIYENEYSAPENPPPWPTRMSSSVTRHARELVSHGAIFYKLTDRD